MSLRKTTAQCNQFFTETMNTAPYTNTNLTKAKLDRMVNHFQHIFLPVTIYQSNVYPRNKSKISYKPLYNYGVLASGNVPPVSMVDINPKTPKKPLMILPVYMRLHNQGVRYPSVGSTGTSSLYSSPLLRSAPLGQNLAMPAKPKSVWINTWAPQKSEYSKSNKNGIYYCTTFYFLVLGTFWYYWYFC